METATATELDLTTGYTPGPKQRAFHASKSRLRGFVAGIGCGKTRAGMYEAMWWLAEPGTVGLAVAPTYPMLTKTVMVWFDECREQWPGYVVDYNRVDRRARFCNGSTLWFGYAADPDSLRGPNLNFFWLDEAALCPAATFDVLLGRIRSEGRQGGWITSTPKGKNWVHDRFAESPQPSYSLFRARLCKEDAPWLSDEFITSLRNAYAGPFAAQELDAEFVAFEGLIYPGFSRERHVSESPRREDLVRTVAGMDFGFTAPGCVLVIGQTADGCVHVLAEEHHRNLSIAGIEGGDWATICRRLQSEWEPEAWYCDPAEPRSIHELQRAGLLSACGANNDVITGIMRVSALVAQGRLLVAPDAVNTIAEFGSYAWEMDRDGNPRENEKPIKAGDHAMDALRYAVAGLMLSGPPSTESQYAVYSL